MANHKHVEMFIESVARKRSRGVGGRREHILMLYNRDDIGSMTTSCTFCMIGMNRSALKRSDRRFDKTRLVECVSMDETLDIKLITDTETSIDSSWRASPVLVKLKATCTSVYLVTQTLGGAIVAFSCDTNVDRQLITCLKHLTHVVSAGCTSSRVGSSTITMISS